MKRKLACILCTFAILLSVISGSFTVRAEGGAEETVYAESLKIGDAFEFGYYPQTVVSDRTLINQLDSIEADMRSYGYVVPYSDTAVDMSYSDITYDGNKYRKVYIGSYRNSGWEQNQAQYQHGYYSKCIYYFKWEPIQWTVMKTDESVVAHADLVLDEKVYRNANEAYWENSDIRTWLNGDFYASAFSEENKAVMVTEEVENKTNADSHIYGGENTFDKVWLLSYYEMTSDNGFPAMVLDKDAFLDASDYAYSQGACYGIDDGYSKVGYFLRDVGTTAAYVCYDSSIFTKSFRAESRAKRFISCREHQGVLPVIAISKTAEITNKTLSSSESEDTSNDSIPETPGNSTQQATDEKEAKACLHTVITKITDTPADFSRAGTVKYRCKTCGKTVKTENRAKVQSVRLNKKNYVFVSNTITPEVIIKTSDGKFLDTANYSVTFVKRNNNKTVTKINRSGQYKAIVVLKEEYTGKKTVYFSVKPAKPKVTSCKKIKKGLIVKWKKPKEKCKYNIIVADNKKFKNAKSYSASSKKGKLTLKKVKAGKKYYIRLKAVKKVTVDGRKAYMYSKYSKKKAVKT